MLPEERVMVRGVDVRHATRRRQHLHQTLWHGQVWPRQLHYRSVCPDAARHTHASTARPELGETRITMILQSIPTESRNQHGIWASAAATQWLPEHRTAPHPHQGRYWNLREPLTPPALTPIWQDLPHVDPDRTGSTMEKGVKGGKKERRCRG